MTGSNNNAQRVGLADGLPSERDTRLHGSDDQAPETACQHPAIPREERWRQAPPTPRLPDGRRARLAISTWNGKVGPTPLEVTAERCGDAHVISYVVRQTNLMLSVDGRTVLDGDVPAGTTILTGPERRQARAVYRRDFDIFRVFVPQFALAESFAAVTGDPAPPRIELFAAQESDDKVLRHLMMSLIRTADEGGPLSPPFLDSIGTTFAAHLIGQYARKHRSPAKRSLSPLAPWRLKRATSFVEANLAQPITLVDLSAAAGLSRMHFAAQFRTAIGVSPHTYVLQRRVEAAKLLLQDPQQTIRRVAVTVGFKSEAHFVNVFRRLVGDSPGRWRRSARQ
jgi:AraC family transcriptional regulator